MEFVYKGLSGQLNRRTVTMEEIDRQLERLRQQYPRIAPVTDRPAQLGDEVVLDYAGFCDGEQFPGGTAEKQTLVLGSGTFIPGFEEQLVDKVPGEEVTVKVTFPEAYHAKELAGKAAEFRCVIHQIRIRMEYELDDTFAKEVGECESMEQFREKLGQAMQNYADEQAEQELQDQLLRQAAATLDVQFSDEQVKGAAKEQLRAMEAQLAQQGLSLQMYCQFMNTTEEKLMEEAAPAAKQQLLIQTAIDRIVLLEKLEASQQEIAECCAMICRQNRITMEQLRQQYDAAMEAAVIRSVLARKALQLVRGAARITESMQNA